jgi:para-nitrobenzyl esterase
VFAYEWMHPLDNPQAHGLGATHSVELWFVFGNADMGIGLSAAEQPLADRTMDSWGAFARRGDPTTPALPWPRYDPASDALVVLDTEPSVATHVKAAICDGWDQVAAR